MIYRAYIYKNLASDLRRFFRRRTRELQFDKDYWLHKLGLATYSPAKRALGAFSLLFLGGAAGALLGLSLAPKKGSELRHQMKDKALKMFERGAITPEAQAQA